MERRVAKPRFVLNALRALMGARESGAPVPPPSPPYDVVVEGVAPFVISKHVRLHQGLPMLDWDAVIAWIDAIEAADRKQQAWTACERGWLLHLRAILGKQYHVTESSKSMLLSSLEPNVARATLDYIDRTQRRVSLVLDGIASASELGKEILIVLDDPETYYRYVSFFYPDIGEFALSSGLHISQGCSHFVTVKADLRAIEPVIAHEMTHGCLAHLPLPLWLNEGLAVNTEHRLSAPERPLYTPAEMREKHLAFWDEQKIQQFWSGRSWHRGDYGNSLSYDLARIMVEQMASDWERFKRFVLAADRADAGARAAHAELGVDLGDYVCALLERDPSPRWAPDPSAWPSESG